MRCLTIRVLIADDHRIIRDGLKTLIEKEAGMEVIAEAENGREADPAGPEAPPQHSDHGRVHAGHERD